MTRAFSAAVLALAVVGCAPSVLWRGRSDDRRYDVRVEAFDGGERVAVGDAAQPRFDRVLVTHLVLGSPGPTYVGERSGASFVVTPELTLGPYDEVGELVVRGTSTVFTARRGHRWSVERVVGRETVLVAADLDGVRPSTLRLEDDGSVACVGLLGGAERLVWEVGGASAMSAPVDAVRTIAPRAGGFLAVLREDGVERLVRASSALETLSTGWEEVLELRVAERGGFAFFGARSEDVVLIHGAPDGVHASVAHPVLTHLRLSDDGAHVACLRPADDGGHVELLRDGAVIATHRRIDGERLAFVPATSSLVWIAEESQAPSVFVDGLESARYAVIEGPVLAEGRLGFIGRERVGGGGESEVVLVELAHPAMDVIAREVWAGQLRVGRHGHAFAARRGGERFVVTQRGSWLVPRFFVDTLVLDDAGDHWAAIVPDRGERELSVWIDGAPGPLVDLDEVASRVVRSSLDPSAVMVELARAELASRSRAPIHSNRLP